MQSSGDSQTAPAAQQTGSLDHASQPQDGDQLFQRIFENVSEGLILYNLETGLVVEANQAACKIYGYTRDEFIGLHPSQFIHVDSSHLFTNFVQTVQSQSTAKTIQKHIRRDGAQFHVEQSGSLFTEAGGSYLLSVVHDISQRVKDEQLLKERVEARTREQSTLLEISQTLASALELQPGLILDQLRVIIDYTLAGLFKLEDSSMAALSVRGPQALEQAMPFKISLKNPKTLKLLFHERLPTRIADVHSPDPPAQLLHALLDDQAALLLEGVQSWMWVPLTIKNRMIGAIGVAHAERNYFTAHHAGLALTVANQAAITMVNAELYENAHTLAALEERQRLARNLHDAVNQSLFSAGLIAEVLPRLWERDPDDGRRSLEDLRRLTRGAQADMRLLLAELRPSTLTDAKLSDLLRLLCSALTGRTNLPIRMTVTGAEALTEQRILPADVQVALYRLCQEGLNNIAKHAGASQVDIQLTYEKDAVELRIQDDGRGFDRGQTVPGHYGLSMMHERATAVGAALSIKSQPGKGTEIVILWKVTKPQEAGKR